MLFILSLLFVSAAFAAPAIPLAEVLSDTLHEGDVVEGDYTPGLEFKFHCEAGAVVVSLTTTEQVQTLFPVVWGVGATEKSWSLPAAVAAHRHLWISSGSAQWPITNEFIVTIQSVADVATHRSFSLRANCNGHPSSSDDVPSLHSNGVVLQGPPVYTLTNAIASFGQAQGGQYMYFQYDVFDVPPGQQCNVTFDLTALSGDPDLFLSFSCQYANATCYDMTSRQYGNDSLVVSPAFVGTYHLGVVAYGSSSSEFSLLANVVCMTDNPAVELFSGVPQNGAIRRGAAPNLYTFSPFPNTGVISITLTPFFGDPDIFITTSVVSPLPASPTNYVWASRSWGADAIEIDFTDSHFCTACTYSIGVTGYTNSEYSITLSTDHGLRQLEADVPIIETVERSTYNNYILYASNQRQIGETITVSVVSLSGDADLFIGVGGPVTADNATWRSISFGDDAITIPPDTPQTCNTSFCAYYVSVYGFQNATYELTVAFSEYAVTISDGIPTLSAVTKGAIQYFVFPVYDTRRNLTLSLNVLSGSAFAIINNGSYPTLSSYRWWIGSSRNVLELSPDCGGLSACVYYIGVKGWTNATFTLTASTGASHLVLQQGVTEFDAVKALAYRYYVYEQTTAGSDLTFSLTAFSGDPDLYISAPPVSFPYPNSSVNTQESHTFGDDEIFFPNAAAGTYYIGVYGYPSNNQGSVYSIVVNAETQQFPGVEWLGEGDVLATIVESGSNRYFRFYNEEEGSQLSIEVLPLLGVCPFFISNISLPNSTFYQYTAAQGLIQIPSAAEGNYFITVQGTQTCLITVNAFTPDSVVDLPDGRTVLGFMPTTGETNEFQYDVVNTTGDIHFYVTAFDGSDPDVYISTSPDPTPSNYTWSSQRFDGETIHISQSDPHYVSTGTYYATVHAFSPNCNYSIVAMNGAGPTALVAGLKQFSDSDSAAFRYYIFVPRFGSSQSVRVSVFTVSGDPVLYASLDSFPTLQSFRWMSKDPNPSITIQQSDCADQNCVLYIGVYGNANPSSTFYITGEILNNP